MADPKPSAPLNGAYYGPPIPPYAIPRRRRHSCCGGLLSSLLKLIVTIVIVLGIAALVLWLIFRPNKIKVYVEDATLTQFNLTNSNNNMLLYNLSLNVSVRNPNKKIGIYYDYIESLAIYDDSRFGFQILPTFYQGHKNTTILSPVFASQNILLGDAPATYAREKTEGFYNIEVKFYMSVRLKAGIFKTHHIKPKFDCNVRLPAPSASSLKTTPFERVKCDVDY
ncbi:hypothetical protein KFK09_017127 [Dendrobium nobile]|uniref:Late embryogenesis abundant protein LEA-2 subgroup domain-containing protein n=1 Tax=Dendrobium nobile TaxID=94219 RepID=A0A8T3B1G5_DENNO|nr:hypothetical protein KFK09_017127 [Dendrobium nobile]